MKKILRLIGLFFLALGFAGAILAQVPAFPGAEGYGAESIGGRGGRVIEVTNLNDAGTGSLRAACEATGARTVVFKVGGTIVTAGIAIKNPYITIAGQTAPGGGICLKLSTTPSGTAEYDCMAIMTHDVIVRDIRFRAGTGSGIPGQPATYSSSSECDAFGCYRSSKVMIDHCSMSWGTDGTFDMWFLNDHITVQNCIISETLNHSTHRKGGHSYGFLLGSDDVGAGSVNYLSIHHNLIADHDERNPRVEGNQYLHVVNNIIYNWGVATSVITTGQSLTGVQTALADYISNYYKEGPNKAIGADIGVEIGSSSGAKVYVSGNISPSRPALANPEWNFVSGSSSFRSFIPLCTGITYPVTVSQYSQNFVDSLFNTVGAIIPNRDVVDTRVVNDAINNTGAIIDDPGQVGGYPVLAGGTAPSDTDHDGMPDSWETAHGLNPNNPTDGILDFNNDGYTNVEKYINSLFPVIVTGVAEIKQNSKISVSPNPIVDQAIITIQSGEMITNWKIYDLSGQLVSVSENQPGSKNELQRGNLRSGMYILKIYTKSGIAGSLKIVMN